MAYTELVRIGEVEFLAQIAESGGAQPVGAQPVYSFDGVRRTIEAVAGQVAEAWEKVKPDEASVEFGLSIAAKSGKLLGLLVDGGGEAALKITLTWRAADQAGKGGGTGSAERAGQSGRERSAVLPDLAEPVEPARVELPPAAPAETGIPGQAVDPGNEAAA